MLRKSEQTVEEFMRSFVIKSYSPLGGSDETFSSSCPETHKSSSCFKTKRDKRKNPLV